MPCNNLRGQLSLFAGGDLGARETSAAREPLKTCPSCRQEYQSFEKTRSMLGNYGTTLSRAPQAPNVWSGVMGRVGPKQQAPLGRLSPKQAPKSRSPRSPQA